MDQAQQTWIGRASEYANKKVTMNSEHLQALGLLAIAEALHRIAQAMESDPRRR